MKNLVSVGIFLFYLSSWAGEPYFVEFTNKDISKKFRPELYFDQKAIQNKKSLGLELYDWYDLPVNPNFISVIKKTSDSLGYVLRWFNGVTAYLNDNQLENVKKLSLDNKDLTEIKTSKNQVNEKNYFVKTFDKEVIKYHPFIDVSGGPKTYETSSGKFSVDSD